MFTESSELKDPTILTALNSKQPLSTGIIITMTYNQEVFHFTPTFV